MKKFLKITIFFLIFVLLLTTIIVAIPDQFENSYQRALVRQYDYFKSIQGNKIVFIGGSSLSFGYNMDLMESLTGVPCPILGNYASYGIPILLEISKDNLIAGDKVVLEFFNCKIDDTAPVMLLSGMGKRYDMYKFIIPEIRKQFLNEFPAYVKTSLEHWRSFEPYDPAPPYSLSSYDERGNMVMSRPEPWISEDYITKKNSDELNYQDYYSIIRDLPAEEFDYLNEYISWCEERDVSVYLTVQSVYDAAVPDYCHDDIINQYDSMLAEGINCPLISRSKDYFFPREFIFDSILHCNSAGAEYRTKLLYRDLKPYL